MRIYNILKALASKLKNTADNQVSLTLDFKNLLSQQVPANSVKDFSIDVSKNGWDAIAIAGFQITVGGFSAVSQAYIQQGTAHVRIVNPVNQNQNSVNIYLIILYYKLGGVLKSLILWAFEQKRGCLV